MTFIDSLQSASVKTCKISASQHGR